jgi:hypothetical protein
LSCRSAQWACACAHKVSFLFFFWETSGSVFCCPDVQHFVEKNFTEEIFFSGGAFGRKREREREREREAAAARHTKTRRSTLQTRETNRSVRGPTKRCRFLGQTQRAYMHIHTRAPIDSFG